MTYTEVPRLEIIEALSNVSFIVLDWEYLDSSFQTDMGEERIAIPATLHDDAEENLKVFSDLRFSLSGVAGFNQCFSNIFSSIPQPSSSAPPEYSSSSGFLSLR